MKKGRASLKPEHGILLLELIPRRVRIIDLKQQILAVNGSVVRWLGYDREALQSIRFLDLLPPESRSEWEAAWDRLLQGEYLLKRQVLMRKDGHRVYVELNTQLLNGKLIAALAKLTDEPLEVNYAPDREDGRCRLLADRVPQFLWTTRPDGTLDYCNRFWRDYTGMPESMCRAGGWAAILHSEDMPRSLASLQTSLEQQTVWEIKQRVRRFDGRYRWFAARAEPLFDTEGRLLLWMGTALDVEDQTHLEEALRKSEELFHDLARLAPVGIFRTDLMGRCIYVNDRWREMTGLSWPEARGDGWTEALHPEDRAEVIAAWESAIRSGSAFQREHRFLRPTGETVWTICQSIPLQGRTEEKLGYIGTLTDITQRKLAEASLRENEEQFRSIFEHAPLGVAIVNAQGDFLQSNRSLQHLLAWTDGELRLRNLPDVIDASDQEAVWRLFLELQSGQRTWFDTEVRLLRKDGEIVWGRLTTSSVRTALDQFLYAIVMIEDVSARKKMEQALHASHQSFQTLATVAPVGVPHRRPSGLHLCERIVVPNDWSVGGSSLGPRMDEGAAARRTGSDRPSVECDGAVRPAVSVGRLRAAPRRDTALGALPGFSGSGFSRGNPGLHRLPDRPD